MFTPGFCNIAFQALPEHTFAWGCWIRDGYRFTYFYGAADDYTAVARWLGPEILHKGICDTLTEARAAAQERAAQLIEVYADVGSTCALTARDCLRLAQVEKPPALHPGGPSGA